MVSAHSCVFEEKKLPHWWWKLLQLPKVHSQVKQVIEILKNKYTILHCSLLKHSDDGSIANSDMDIILTVCAGRTYKSTE